MGSHILTPILWAKTKNHHFSHGVWGPSFRRLNGQHVCSNSFGSGQIQVGRPGKTIRFFYCITASRFFFVGAGGGWKNKEYQLYTLVAVY